ncbi:MAG: hypothetical protein IJU20_08510 [Clostridia bacterium]|nr:hypothetical protein [Clostridia bacterium]
MEKRSLTHRLENSQLTQMALFPIKLMAILLSMVILFVSLPLSALAVDNGSSTAPEETDSKIIYYAVGVPNND